MLGPPFLRLTQRTRESVRFLINSFRNSRKFELNYFLLGTAFYETAGLILLLSGDTGACEYYNIKTQISTTFTCIGLPNSDVSLAAINGPNVYVIQNNGVVYEANCVLASACPYGCNNGVCNNPPAAPVAPPVMLPVPPIAVNPPVAAVPFSACSQCKAPTPYCITSLQLCIGKRVTPILQCVESVGALRRGHFSYNSAATSTFSIDSGSANNYISPTGSPTAQFTPGRQNIYPVDAFTVRLSKVKYSLLMITMPGGLCSKHRGDMVRRWIHFEV